MPAEPRSTAHSWLVDVASTELRAQRLIFLFVLGPLLGYWMPALMFSLGIAFTMITTASAAGLQDESIGDTLPWVIGFALPLLTIAVGLIRERRRLTAADQGAAAVGLRLPERQRLVLREHYEAIWRNLAGAAELPRLICISSFAITAHAYENEGGRAIEVSSGLASRVVREDPVALSILRHEVAHLVYRDLPAIRRQSLVGGAALFSANCAMAVCLLAALIIVGLTDFRPFPIKPTLGNIVLVHLAILLATLIVITPLLLGRYVVRRYAGFLIALAEMRADVSAGVWGAGLDDFSARLDWDPTVRGTTMLDLGLSYISTSLSHFSGRERIALLRQPARLATPKLRYFAGAILCIWFLQFHQGDQGWDVLLLACVIALLQGLTVAMVLRSAGEFTMPVARAATLAVGVLAAQALPFVKVEIIAYLTQSMTLALVSPGGFGPADSSYIHDTLTSFAEFGGSAVSAVGGAGFGIAIVIAAAFYLSASRSSVAGAAFRGRLGPAVIAAIVCAASLCVSYRFFQSQLGDLAEKTAFALSGSEGEWLPGLPFGSALNQELGRWSLGLSGWLDGPPILEHFAWLRLVIPQLAGATAVLTAVTLHAIFGRRSPEISAASTAIPDDLTLIDPAS